MNRRMLVAFSILLLGVAGLGCQPLVQGPQSGEVPISDGIPLVYGDLASVTLGSGGWNLWFQQADGTVIGVWLGHNSALGEQVLTIPRR